MDEATNKMSTDIWDDDRTDLTPQRGSTMASESTDLEDQQAEQIRAEIEDTRAEMSLTINEIQERLSPEHVMDQVKQTVREATLGKVERVMNKVGETISEVSEPAMQALNQAGGAIKETGKSLADSAWRNPIPFGLIGLGVCMLVMRKSRGGNGYDYDVRRTTPRTQRSEHDDSKSRCDGCRSERDIEHSRAGERNGQRSRESLDKRVEQCEHESERRRVSTGQPFRTGAA